MEMRKNKKPNLTKSQKRDKAITELKRELRIRKSFYARRVKSGRMTKEKANSQYLALEYALELLEESKSNEPQQGSFFDNY